MSNTEFEDYENLLSNLAADENQLAERTQLFLNQQHQMQLQQQQQQQLQLHQKQQQQMQFNESSNEQQQQSTQPQSIAESGNQLFQDNFSQNRDDHSQFGSYVSDSSHYGSEVNFNELNDAVSSLNSGLLSPYSTGSSPDDFFLNGGNSQTGSQYGQNDGDFNLNTNSNHNDVLYPNQFIPVPMAESASNSTVTFNNNDYQSAQQMVPTLNTVEEAEEDFIKKESPEIKLEQLQNIQNPSMHSLQSFESDHSNDMQQRLGGRKVKSSHNLIEKKYRTNINSKIIELRNCVPALRILVAKNGNHRTSTVNNEAEDEDDYYEGNGFSDDEEKLDGLKPAKKLNKATILAKASEYIRHLEKKTDILREQNMRLQSILENSSSFNVDQMLSQQSFQQPNPQYYQSQSTSMHSSPFNRSNNSNSNSNRGNSSLVSPNDINFQNQQLPDHQSLTNKLMMGGIGGLFGVSALDDLSSGSNMNQRNLFALPMFSFGTSSAVTGTSELINFSNLLSCLIKVAIAAYIFRNYVFVGFKSYIESVQKTQQSNSVLETAKTIVNKSVCTTFEASEKVLLKSVESSDVNSIFYTEALKTLQLSDEPKHSLLKALYISRLIHNFIPSDGNTHVRNSFSKIITQRLQKLGSSYWEKSSLYLNNRNMSELANTPFECFSLNETVMKSKSVGRFTTIDEVLQSATINVLFSNSMNMIAEVCLQKMNSNIHTIAQSEATIKHSMERLLSFDLSEVMKMKCQLMLNFVNPDIELLASLVNEFNASNDLEDEADIKTAILCSILKHNITNNYDTATVDESLGKLNSNLVAKKLSKFQFISLLNVIPLLQLDQVRSTKCENPSTTVQAVIDQYEINKRVVDYQLIHTLDHMREYLGNETAEYTRTPQHISDYCTTKFQEYMLAISEL